LPGNTRLIRVAVVGRWRLTCNHGGSVRRFLADTIALIVFSTALGSAVEIGLAGLTWKQSLQIRLAAIPVALLTGRLYGVYRDALTRSLAVRAQPGRLLPDIVANTTFQLPLYALLLWWNGAIWRQMLIAMLSILPLVMISGPPYALFLVWCRHLFGIRSPDSEPS
jgi:hypothetical protein